MPQDDKFQSQGDRGDNVNPFIAFRRFADQQMSNLVDTVFGLSRSFDSQRRSHERTLDEYQAWLQAAREPSQNPDKEAAEARRIMDVYLRAQNDSAEDDFHKAIQDAEQPLRCPYRSSHQEVPSQRNVNDEACPSPMEYLLFNPYSPLQLERQESLRDHKWRECFEDLIDAQNEREAAAEECQKSQVEACFGRLFRGLGLEMQKQRQNEAAVFQRLVTAMNSVNHADDDEAEDDDDLDDEDDEDDDDFEEEDEVYRDDNEGQQLTELDLYKHFAGLQDNQNNESSSSSSQSQSRYYSNVQPDSTPVPKEYSKPSILSTLTTTERNTSPDGTIHTRVVLKKRFSDGHEECNETTHTQNPPPKLQYQPPTKLIEDKSISKDLSKGNGNGNSEKRSKGWFWS